MLVLSLFFQLGGALDSTAKEVAEQLVAQKYDSVVSHFDGTMKAVLPPAKLGEVWKKVEAASGGWKKLGGITPGEVRGIRTRSVALEFANATLDLELAFDDKELISGLHFLAHWRPAKEVDPAKFQEREITFSVGPIQLPGTLTIPRGKSKAPVVVLVHGSGPNDRDETIGPNKIFKDLAFALASRGIAVLRYEKATKQHPDLYMNLSHPTVRDEVIDAAQAALDFIAKQPEIDAKRIFLAGHSQGGYLLPRIATAKVAGLIMLEGATRPLEEAVLDQLRYLKQDKALIKQAKALIEAVRDPKLTQDAKLDVLGSKTPGSYFLDLRGYDPAKQAAALKKPVLVIQGSRDYQVTVKGDLPAWKRALEGKPGARIVVLDGLNHLLIKGQGPSLPAEYQVAGHVDGAVYDEIEKFINSQP